jgi:hypothetical protein
MIKGLQGITGITVSGGSTSMPYVQMSNGNMSNPMQGMLRINGTDMEVFNNNTWQMLSTSYATVSLDQDTLDTVQWARKKRDEELEWQNLAATSEAVKIALDNLEQAKQQLAITTHLAKDINETTS